MELSILLFKQVIVMLIILFVGVLCYKKKIISLTGKQELSSLLLMIVNPITIFMSYQREFQPELFQNLLISFGLAIASYFIVIPLCGLLIPTKNSKYIIERFCVIYSNCGFFGIPLISSVYGSEGVFYLSAHMAIFQFFGWTHGFLLMRGKTEEQVPLKDMLKSLVSPAIIAPFLGIVLFLCRVTLPEQIGDSFNTLAAMNTPLAMLVAGMTLAQSNVKRVFAQPRIYYISFLKLVVFPLAILLLAWPLGLDPMVSTVAMIATGCPSAVLAVLFAVRFERDAVYGSEIFTASTILCALTLPVLMYLAQWLLVG